ncbi:hypothetical protein BDF20DRAFT_918116 [Mycotypha africana]|uniref:uncharacterized protein n=1 Tax=Mycotypha africana TaxID=64632 RepID=UPI002301DC2D|nr:uncharacterized protein BDF20DRAFT_918116 [Mycotypha africana]KAI8966897.1 hypothetical protein BDF20DRAFT_918116 [Mycotypha africana]
MDSQSKIMNNLIAKPDIFTGDKADENPLLWLKQVDRLRTGLSLTDDNILFIIGNHLRGRAEICKIRYFKNALRKDIQYELDRARLRNPTWNEVTDEARSIELLQKKHNLIDYNTVTNQHAIVEEGKGYAPGNSNTITVRRHTQQVTISWNQL